MLCPISRLKSIITNDRTRCHLQKHPIPSKSANRFPISNFLVENSFLPHNTTHRSMHTDQFDTVKIKGKVASPFYMFWCKYKYHLIGSSTALGMIGGFGLSMTATIFTGLITTIGGGIMLFTRHLNSHRNTLLIQFEDELNKNRKKIQVFLGPFELPSKSDIATDQDVIKGQAGEEIHVLRNIFYLNGKYGRAFCRLMGRMESSGTWVIQKLVIDLHDFRNNNTGSIILVDNVPKRKIVDAIKSVKFPGQSYNVFHKTYKNPDDYLVQIPTSSHVHIFQE